MRLLTLQTTRSVAEDSQNLEKTEKEIVTETTECRKLKSLSS